MENNYESMKTIKEKAFDKNLKEKEKSIGYAKALISRKMITYAIYCDILICIDAKYKSTEELIKRII